MNEQQEKKALIASLILTAFYIGLMAYGIVEFIKGGY